MYSNIEIPSKFSEIINSNEEEKLKYFSAYDFIDSNPKISYYNKYGLKSNFSFPACYIFLIDQSGSMSGYPITILKDTLILFLKSLPFDSYFQIIGFGSDFIKYNEQPILYNTNNIQNIIEVISNFQANLGGTNLYEPLKEIYQQLNSNNNLNLPINIIIITDGKVNNVEKCINIIDIYKEKFRVHSIGIGENYSKYLIEKSAIVGRGLKFFIENVEEISYKIFDILNIYSNYLKNIKIKFINNLEYFEKKKFNVLPNSSFINQNDIISYGFICKGKIISPEKIIQISINFDNNDKNNDEIIDIKKIENLNDGNELSKLIIGILINNNLLNKNLDKNTIIQLSKDYEVLSKYTCFFGYFENKEKNVENSLINLNNFCLADNTSDNIQIFTSKTGKHGHAKTNKRILNEKEFELNNLIENYSDSEINNEININNENFIIIKRIIKEQNIENGYWEKKLFNDRKYEEIYKKIFDFFIKQNIKDDLLTNICCTFSIIYFLNQKYSLYMNIWKQVVIKGLYYLKKNNIDYDKLIYLIDLK